MIVKISAEVQWYWHYQSNLSSVTIHVALTRFCKSCPRWLPLKYGMDSVNTISLLVVCNPAKQLERILEDITYSFPL